MNYKSFRLGNQMRPPGLSAIQETLSSFWDTVGLVKAVFRARVFE